MKQTILRVRKVGKRVEARFRGRNGGARNWPHIVDHFVASLAAVCAVLGKAFISSTPTMGRGEVVSIPQSAYVAARVIWETDAIVAKAIADKALEVEDESVVSELALHLARAHHAPLIAAAKALAEADALTSISPSTEDDEDSPDMDDDHAEE